MGRELKYIMEEESLAERKKGTFTMSNPASSTSLAESYLTTILENPNTPFFPRNDPTTPSNPAPASESSTSNQLFPLPGVVEESGLKWFQKKFVNQFYRRFCAVSRAGAHTKEQLILAYDVENLEVEDDVVLAVRDSILSVMKVCNGILHFERQGLLRMSRSGPVTAPRSKPDFYIFHAIDQTQRVICFIEDKKYSHNHLPILQLILQS